MAKQKEKIKTKTVHQTVSFKAEPAKVYDALMNSKKHSAFTGDTAVISPRKGGMFSTFGGWAHGRNLRLTKNKDIVQTWIAADWPNHHTSVVHFHLFPLKKGKETKLEFVHQKVPVFAVKGISEGWKENYWQPMKRMLEK